MWIIKQYWLPLKSRRSLMKKITIKNEDQLEKVLTDSTEGDTIELLPGEYFLPEKAKCYTISRNLTIIGQSLNAKNTKVNASFLIGKGITLNLRNFTLNYDKAQLNTIALYDGAELALKNMIVDHAVSDRWNTIYSQDSFLSLTDSEIMNTTNQNIASLQMESGKMYAVNSKISFLNQKRAKVFLKKSLISYGIALADQAALSLRDLTIVSFNNLDQSDMQVANNSSVEGENLIFAKKEPHISISKSDFEIKNFEPAIDKINWSFDDDSTVLVDGKTLDNKHNK